MWCAKAGIAAQLCNWIFGLPLVTGHSDDDQQIEQTKILELEKMFADGDLSDGKIIAFLNVFDKGYHQILEALKQGQFGGLEAEAWTFGCNFMYKGYQ